LQPQNEKDEQEEGLTNKELEVVEANLRAWNYWGLTWRLERKNRPPDTHTSQVMKMRALTYRKVYLQIVSSLQGLRAKTIVDIGCGTSDYLKWLSDDCRRLVGVGISVEMLKLTREDLYTRGKSIDLVAADALHLPFKDEAFDVGTTFQALHHFPDWKEALAEMVRTARQISLYEPNGDSFLHRLMHLIRKYSRVEQRFKQTEDDYSLVEFQASGFRQKRIRGFLQHKNVDAKAFMFGMIPVSILGRISSLSPILLRYVGIIEELLQKAPILQNQLGNMLLIGWKRNI